MGRYKGIQGRTNRSSEIIDYDTYINNYQFTSDIRGAGVDIVIVDDGFDIMHYEYRDNIQLVDWNYLIDFPECTWDEWRSHDFTHSDLNNAIKDIFQQELDTAVSNGGFDPDPSFSPYFYGQLAYIQSTRTSAIETFNFDPMSFAQVDWRAIYADAFARELTRPDGSTYPGGMLHYLNLGGQAHGTSTLSNIVGDKCGLAKDSPVYIVSTTAYLSYRPTKGETYMDFATLLAQCKTRSGITRPTVKSMSMSFGGDPDIPIHKKTKDHHADPIIENAFTQSVKLPTPGPLGGEIDITISDKTAQFIQLLKDSNDYAHESQVRHAHVGYSGSLAYSEQLYSKVKENNELLDYIEKTWQYGMNYTVLRNGNQEDEKRYNIFSIPKTLDDQRHKPLYDEFYKNNGHTFRSAGNDGYVMNSIAHQEATIKAHAVDRVGGFATSRQWDTGSIINLYPRTPEQGITPSNGNIYAVFSDKSYEYLNSTDYTSSDNIISTKQVIHNSGSLSSHIDIGAEWPYTWRARPIWSNIPYDDTIWNKYGALKGGIPPTALNTNGLLIRVFESQEFYLILTGSAVSNVTNIQTPEHSLGEIEVMDMPYLGTASISIDDFIAYNETFTASFADNIQMIKHPSSGKFYIPGGYSSFTTLEPNTGYNLQTVPNESGVFNVHHPFVPVGPTTQSIKLTDQRQRIVTNVDLSLPPYDSLRLEHVLNNIYTSPDYDDRATTYIQNGFELIRSIQNTSTVYYDPNNAFKYLYITSSNGTYSCDLDIIKSDPAFPSNGEFITGSFITNNLPKLNNTNGTDIAQLDSTDFIFEDLQKLEQTDPKLTDYHYNGAYNIDYDLGYSSDHPTLGQGRSEHPILSNLHFTYKAAIENSGFITNTHTLTSLSESYNFIGLLLEPYDKNENIISGSPIVAIKEMLPDAHLAATSSEDISTFKAIAGVGGFSRFIPEQSTRPLSRLQTLLGENFIDVDFEFPFTPTYFSGSLNTAVGAQGVTPNVIGNLKYIFNEDTTGIGLYNELKNPAISPFVNFMFEDEPITDYMLHTLSQSVQDTGEDTLTHTLILLKESPSIGRNLRVSTRQYSPLKLSGYPTEMDCDPRANVSSATTLYPQRDRFQMHDISGSYHFPPTHLTSSLNTEYKSFYVSASSRDLEPSDCLANFTSRGGRCNVSAPGEQVMVAGVRNPSVRALRTSDYRDNDHGFATRQVTLLDYFDSSSVYSKLPFALASCSFDNMRTSEGELIPQLGWMTGSSPTASVNIALRECIMHSNTSAITYAAPDGSIHPYKHVNGTSFSCPLTAGVAALWLDLNPHLSQLELQQVLASSAYVNQLKDRSIYEAKTDTEINTINDFDKFLFGISQNIFGVSKFTRDIFFEMSDYEKRVSIAGTSLSYYEPIYNAKLRRYLYGYTDQYDSHAVYNTPNAIVHWPYSQTNRADIQGNFANLILSGSMTFNNG